MVVQIIIVIGDLAPVTEAAAEMEPKQPVRRHDSVSQRMSDLTPDAAGADGDADTMTFCLCGGGAYTIGEMADMNYWRGRWLSEPLPDPTDKTLKYQFQFLASAWPLRRGVHPAVQRTT